jgi:hypothetical protein
MGCFGNPKFPINWVCYLERCLSVHPCAREKVKNLKIETMEKERLETFNK